MVRRALTPTTALWRRRHDDPDALLVSAGIGDVAWSLPLDRRASSTRLDPAVKELVEDCVLTDAPAQVDLTGAGVVGVVGGRETALSLAGSLLVQACVHCGPADLTVGVFHDPGRGEAWERVPWLPHTRRPGPGEEGRWVSGQRRTSEAMLRRGGGAPGPRRVTTVSQKAP